MLQDQRTDPSTLLFNIKLTQLIPIGLDQTNFLNEVVITHPIKKVLDSTLYRPFEYIIEIDIDDIAIFRDRELIM